jgi:hypothetical protein
VRTLTGKTITLTVVPDSTTVWAVKRDLAQKQGFKRPEDLRLVFRGKSMDDIRLLSLFGVTKDSTLHLLMPIPVQSMVTLPDQPE